MKLSLILALILSTHAYAQDNNQDGRGGHNGGKHGDGGHGSMHGDAHHGDGGGHGHGGPKLDKTVLKRFFEPLPESIIDEKKNAALIKLGRKLYLDPRLSVTDKLSCNSCHKLDGYGVDNEPTSPGHAGERGDRNSPTTFNAAFNIAQFWDGRAGDLEEQALGPILNPVEMGMASGDEVINKIKNDEQYKTLFAKAFKKEKKAITYDNLGKAIAAFERTLITPSRFDKFLKGDEDALSKREKRGLKKFVDIGCVTCHNGVGVGGNSYRKIGLVEPYETKDMGRYEVTKIESDKKVFKVPTLRNVTQTAPYFHDGSVKTLDEAIQLMAKHQLGKEVDHESVKDIKAFLGSLTGKSEFLAKQDKNDK